MININSLPLEQVLAKIKLQEFPLSTLNQIHDYDKEQVNETVLMKAIYMEHPFRQEIIDWLNIMPYELLEESFKQKSALGWPLIHMAVMSNCYKEVQILLQRKQDNNFGYATKRKLSLLQTAIFSSDVKMAQLVYQYDKDIDYVNAQNKRLLDYTMDIFSSNHLPLSNDMISFIVQLYSVKDLEAFISYEGDECDPFNSDGAGLPIYSHTIIQSIIEKKKLEAQVQGGELVENKAIKI